MTKNNTGNINTNNKKKRYAERDDYTVKELILRIFPYFKPYKKTLATDLFCAALTTVCEIVLPMIIRKMTNTAVADLTQLTYRMVLGLSFLYFVLRIIDSFANYYMACTGHIMGAKIETDMRRSAYAHLQRLSDSYYNNTKVGQIMGRITNDLFDITEFAHHCPEEFFIAAIKITVSFIILARINLYLTLLIFVFVPVMTVVCRKINRGLRRAFAQQRLQIGELNANIEDSLLGQRVVKAFANEDLENQKFEKGNQKFLSIKKFSYRMMGLFQTSTRVFDGLMYLTVILGGGLFLINGKILPGDMVAYVMFVSTLITTIRKIIEFAEQFQRGMTGIERFLQIMDADIEIFDSEDAKDITDVKGEIEFKNVCFEYPDDHNKVLKSLSIKINAGEKLAIVGPSGGGKTTLCNLIPRFYDVTSGSITIDGVDVKDVTLKSLRQNIGMVQQDVYLFSGTIKENILYGKPNATEEEIISAAKRAGADEFIKGLKDGYDTYIGERGVKLSGGQRQRISIARIFLKDPKIIILDEATSALDNESEYLVAKSLNELSKGRTTLTIAHRLSSIRRADRILVLTDNGIEEEGSHSELMKLDGIYKRFYDMTSDVK